MQIAFIRPSIMRCCVQLFLTYCCGVPSEGANIMLGFPLLKQGQPQRLCIGQYKIHRLETIQGKQRGQQYLDLTRLSSQPYLTDLGHLIIRSLHKIACYNFIRKLMRRSCFRECPWVSGDGRHRRIGQLPSHRTHKNFTKICRSRNPLLSNVFTIYRLSLARYCLRSPVDMTQLYLGMSF